MTWCAGRIPNGFVVGKCISTKLEKTTEAEMRMFMKRLTFLLAMLSVGMLCWAGTAREDATERLDNAANVLHEIMGMPDNGIPEEVLEHAKCVAVVAHMVKAGFVFGGKGGKGVAHLQNCQGLERACLRYDFRRTLGAADRCRSCGPGHDHSE